MSLPERFKKIADNSGV